MIKFDLYQTLAIAVVSLIIGTILKKRISFLEKFCIPSPVIGGILIAVLVCVLHATGTVDLAFDETFKDICMVFFFTSVGFHADIRLLKKGGKDLGLLLLLLIIIIVMQNVLAVGFSKVLGLDSAIGLCTGSIPMTGGHGTSVAFGPLLEQKSASNATTVAVASATFGLIAGSLLGGPIANNLIQKKNLLQTAVDPESIQPDSSLVRVNRMGIEGYAIAAFQLVIAAGIGTLISSLFTKTGITFPVYIGGMLAAALIRNIGECTGKLDIAMTEISDIGNIMLPLFLGIAMITMKLWDLAALALPMILLLTVQVVFMFLFARFVVFRVLGADYDAAVITAGVCGFGMGATPNAMANMKSVCDKYAPSFKAFMLVPIVGSLFADFINSFIVTATLNFI